MKTTLRVEPCLGKEHEVWPLSPTTPATEQKHESVDLKEMEVKHFSSAYVFPSPGYTWLSVCSVWNSPSGSVWKFVLKLIPNDRINKQSVSYYQFARSPLDYNCPFSGDNASDWLMAGLGHGYYLIVVNEVMSTNRSIRFRPPPPRFVGIYFTIPRNIYTIFKFITYAIG